MFNGVLTGLGLARKIYGFPVKGIYKFMPAANRGAESCYKQQLSDRTIRMICRKKGTNTRNAFAVLNLNGSEKFLAEIDSKGNVIEVSKRIIPKGFLYEEIFKLNGEEEILNKFKEFTKFAGDSKQFEVFLKTFDGFWQKAKGLKRSSEKRNLRHILQTLRTVGKRLRNSGESLKHFQNLKRYRKARRFKTETPIQNTYKQVA